MRTGERWPLAERDVPHGSRAGGWPPPTGTVTLTRARDPASTGRRISSQLQRQLPRSTVVREETLWRQPIHHHSTEHILLFSAPGAARGSPLLSRRHWKNLASAKPNISQTRPAQHAVQTPHLHTLTALANLHFPPKACPESTLRPSPGSALAGGLGQAVHPGIGFGRKEAERVARWRVTFAFRGS